mmetsp:Transcript_9005/g.25228  ORF Transcript_9005/g.25228 Transcript_9005/m.25228 type:complete len:198 (-) Transcript_9005:318-911(-)
MGDLVEQLARHDVAMRVVLIGCASYEQGREFLRTLEVPLSGTLLLDMDRVTHRIAGLHRGVVASLLAPLGPGIMKYGWAGVFEGIALAFEKGHLVGDSWQQGGVVVLDEAKTVLYLHRERHPADWADFGTVLDVATRSGSSGRHSVSHQEALATYLRAREGRVRVDLGRFVICALLLAAFLWQLWMTYATHVRSVGT